MLDQPFSLTLFEQLGITVALGGLIGLQREHAGSPLGGVRTFPLIAVLGTLSVHLEPSPESVWLMMTGFVCITALAIAGNLIFASQLHGDRSTHAGLTTEVAMLLTFTIGALLARNETIVAVVLAGAVAVLLQFKAELKHFTGKLDAYDIKAIMQFVLLSLVVLPLVPNHKMGPYDVLNPHNIWLMVVLIVGIGLGGYVAYKFIGQRAGLLVNALLGGLISTTATTLSFARQTKISPNTEAISTVIVTLASSVLFVRVLVEISAVSPVLLAHSAIPFGILFFLTTTIAMISWARAKHSVSSSMEHKNPTELKTAIVFAILYAGVLLGMAAVKDWIGDEGLYVVAFLSGVTGVDAVTLSTARLVHESLLPAEVGWRVICVAILSNFIFKLAVVGFIGTRIFFGHVAIRFLVICAAGLALLLLW